MSDIEDALRFTPASKPKVPSGDNSVQSVEEALIVPKVQPKTPSVSANEDVARSLKAQGILGLTDIAGIVGGIGQLSDLGIDAAKKYGSQGLQYFGLAKPGFAKNVETAMELTRQAQSPEEKAGLRNKMFGVNFWTPALTEKWTKENIPSSQYEAQTLPGKYAGTAARFASGSALTGGFGGAATSIGRGTLKKALEITAKEAAKQAGISVGSGLTSEAAGQLAESQFLGEDGKPNPYTSTGARILGAVAGQLGTPKIVGGAQRLIAPQAAAKRELIDSLANDLKRGTSSMTPQQIEAAIDSGSLPMLYDMAGDETKQLLRNYANMTDRATRARVGIDKSIQERSANFSEASKEGLADYISDVFGGGVSPASRLEALKKTTSAERDRVYKLAKVEPSAASINSPVIDELTDIPAFKTAMSEAADWAKDLTREAVPASKQNGVSGNLSYWDEVYRNLRGQADTYRNAGNTDLEAKYRNVASRLRTELDSIVPEYGAARSVAKEGFGAEDAITAGYESAKKMDAFKHQDFLTNYNKLSTAQKEEFSQGAAGYLFELAQSEGAEKLLRVLSKPNVEERFRVALGDGAFNAVLGKATSESLLNGAEALGASSSPSRFSGLKTPFGISGVSLLPGILEAFQTQAAWNPSARSIGMAAAGITTAAALTVSEKRVASRIIELAASKDPKKIKELGKLVSENAAARSTVNKINDYSQTLYRNSYLANPTDEPKDIPKIDIYNTDPRARPQRASGGRAVNHADMAEKLVRQAERVKKVQGQGTEALLNHQDDAIISALEIANRHI